MINRILRPHQERAITMLRQSLGPKRRRRPLLQAPTGAGKTIIGAAIIDMALVKSKRVIFTVPALSLIDQTVERFAEEGIGRIGVIQAAHPLTNPDQPVQIASVQTLLRRQIPPADLVLVDEAHRWFDFYARWMNDPAWTAVPFVGLSATPWTKGLGLHYDDLLVPTTIRELIEQGYLSPFKVFAPNHPDLSRVRTLAGDYHEGDLADAMMDRQLTADIVQTWLKLGEGRPTLGFAVDRAHAKTLQREFERVGVPCGYVDAYTGSAEREEIRQAFHAGDLKIVWNVGVLTTGVDWDVRCIILARPTKSEMLFVQIIGRGLRTADGKDHCLILDHSDNHLRLGFVTDIHHDALDQGKMRQKSDHKDQEVLPKECPQCHFLRPPKVSPCPNCGFKPEIRSKIVCEEGDLVELLPNTKTKPVTYTPAQKRRIYGMFKHAANERGYDGGWAAHKFKDYTGDWPNGLRDATPVAPTPEIRSWIKAATIRWARRKNRLDGPAANTNVEVKDDVAA